MGCGCGKSKEQVQAERQAKLDKRAASREARLAELEKRGVKTLRQ